MTEQMLLDYTVAEPEAWQAAFDTRAELRGQAGLTVLQIWVDQQAPGQLVCLFSVHDRKRAMDWLAVETALHQAGTARFLRTL